MKRLLTWLFVIGVLLVGVMVIGPTIGHIDWKGSVHSRSDSPLTDESFRKIHNGMNRLEVTAILGLPSEDHMGSHMASVAESGIREDVSRFLLWTDDSTEMRVYFNPEGFVISKSRNPLPP
jgi:hypothetical protein